MVLVMDETKRAFQERDLYRRLLDLAHSEAIGSLVQESLQLAVEISGAQRAYLRLDTPDGDGPHPASLAHECTTEDLTTIESNISSAIVGEAMARGRTIQTPSALLDARFKDRQSVRTNEIEAVLCAPIGSPEPAGVLYLQGHSGGGPFADEVQHLVECFAKHVGLFVHRMLEQRAREALEDPTASWRDKLACRELVGRSEAMARLLEAISSVARFDGVDVLLTGESGSGKTMVARTIANNSPRAEAPFVVLSCANLTDELFEADLFGAKRGAHSMAHEDAPGKLEVANGGTLFLDEVAELSPRAQAKLLQFVQTREYYRLGDTKPRRADVRLVYATHADLEERVARGEFREDLFYRISVMPIRVPSLAERRADIPALLEAMVERAATESGLPSFPFLPATLYAARIAPWPGNVRMLEHAVKRALICAYAEGAEAIDVHHLLPEQRGQREHKTYQEATLDCQKRILEEGLRRNEWNITESAKELGLTRSHVYNLMRAFGLRRPD